MLRCHVSQVASRYASSVALCESASLKMKLHPVEEWSTTAIVRSYRLERSTAEGGMTTYYGTCGCVVKGSNKFRVASLAYESTGGDQRSKNYND